MTKSKIFCDGAPGGLLGASVELMIKGVEVPGVQLLLLQPESLAESLEVDNLPFPQELDGIPGYPDHPPGGECCHR